MLKNVKNNAYIWIVLLFSLYLLGNQLVIIIKKNIMTYTSKQIESAKKAYSRFLNYESANNYEISVIGINEAERRAEYHNNIVSKIKSGDSGLERKWKLFFLNEQVKEDQKLNKSKAKLAANKEASADILAPIKSIKKLGDFGKWLNNSSNPFRKQHFNKKYTAEAVNAFLETL